MTLLEATDRLYDGIRVSPLTGAIGAEVAGVDLAALDADTFDELHDAFLRYKVLFFRSQGHVTTAQHVAFGQRWGRLEIHPFVANVPEHPEVIVLESTAEKPNAAETWHTDVTFRACPPLGSVLRGCIIPAVGGDTVWANMQLAYERLPDRVKEQIDGKVAVHSMEKVFGRGMSAEKREESLREFPPQSHPVVRTHPETGSKALFVNKPFTMYIKDVEPDESKRLLELLTAQASVPQYQCRFRWQPDSFAMWDNRCTQHYAVPDFYPAHRRMERVTIMGDRPR
ncbi:MAG: taurine dioxygenase [Acidimicrobiia bacterium]|jgi:taurine dioxygenase|nr:taurine dioxygenase [Acidimicrobiia bacterium]